VSFLLPKSHDLKRQSLAAGARAVLLGRAETVQVSADLQSISS